MLKKIIFALIPLLCLALLAELGIRAYFLIRSGYITGPIASYSNDSLLGWKPNPNFRLSYFSFDKYGFRNPAFREDHPNVVLFVGGSTTFGTGNSNEEAYPHQFELACKERGYDIEAVNAGVTGHSMIQIRHELPRLLQLTKARAVIINSCWNTGREVMPYFKNDHLPTYFLFENTFSFRLLDRTLQKASLSLHYRNWPPPEKQFENIKRLATDESTYVSYGEDVATVIDICNSYGAVPVFIYPPSLIYDRAAQTTADKFVGSKFGEKDFAFFETGIYSNRIKEQSWDVVKKLAGNRGIVLLDANEPFQKMPTVERAELFYDQIHLLPPGNKILAEYLVLHTGLQEILHEGKR